MNANTKLPEFAGGQNHPSGNYYHPNHGNHQTNQMYNRMPTFDQPENKYSPNSSFSTDSFYSQTNRPKKKIFQLSNPSEPNMMINAPPIKYQNHTNSQMNIPPTQDPQQYDPRNNYMQNYQNYPSNQYENLRNPPQQFFQGPSNKSMQYQSSEPFQNTGNYNQQANQHLRYVSDVYGNPMQNMNRTPTRQRPQQEEGFNIRPPTPTRQNNYSNYQGHEFPNQYHHHQQHQHQHQHHQSQPQSNKNIPESLHNISGNQGVNEADFDAMSLYSAASSKRRTTPIVILNINVGNGAKEELKLFDGEDPSEVAKTFCIKYNLTPAIHPVLTKNLSVQAEKFYEMRAQKKQQRMLQNQTLRSQNNLDEQASMYSERTNQRAHTEADYQDNYDTLDTSFKSHRQTNYQQQKATRRNDGAQTERNASKSPVNYQVNPILKKSEKENSSKSFNKSYYEEKEQDEDQPNQPSERKEGQRIFKNEVFEKLYQQGMKNKNKKELASKDIKQQMTQEDLREATFHPQINKVPKYLQNKKQQEVPSEEDFEKKLEYQQKRKERAQLLKEILELEGCADQPQSTPKNKVITPKTDRSKSPIHNRLHEEAAKKKDKESIVNNIKQQQKSIVTINTPSTTKAVRDKHENQHHNFQPNPWQEGLRKSKSISKIKDERSVSPVDSKTNQPMFKPKINKENPYYKNVAKNRDSTFIVRQLEIDEDEFKQVQTSRNSRGIKLHDLDESKSVDRSRSVKSTKNNTQSKNDANKSDHVVTFGGKNVKENVNPFFLHDITSNNESRDHNTSVGSVNIQKHPSLFENEQDKIILMKIFQCLDSNRDGRITAQDVDYSSLDAEVLEVIKDIIFSLEDDVVMTFEGFVKEIYENNLMIQLREMKELFQIGSNQQKEPFLVIFFFFII